MSSADVPSYRADAASIQWACMLRNLCYSRERRDLRVTAPLKLFDLAFTTPTLALEFVRALGLAPVPDLLVAMIFFVPAEDRKLLLPFLLVGRLSRFPPAGGFFSVGVFGWRVCKLLLRCRKMFAFGAPRALWLPSRRLSFMRDRSDAPALALSILVQRQKKTTKRRECPY